MQEDKKTYEELEEELKKEKRKKKRKDIIIVILILLLLLIWTILYMAGYRIGKIGYDTVSTETPLYIIEITENEIDWGDIEDLNIFSNPEFENKKIIAPRSQSSYKFAIENKLDNKVVYNIAMSETNEYNVNMKYKLKLDNVYIVGDEDTWVDVEDMQLDKVIVMPNSKNIYTVEWYWEDANNDTEIGKQIYAEYKLHINIEADIYNE